MKMTKDKRKGITLIEVIISVALLSILIIPVSGIIMTSLQTNKKAEYKQKSAYIGQKILEELKVYSYINLQGNSSFQLLDGNFINKYVEADNKYDFIGDFTRDGYKVNVTLKKDSRFKYEDSNNNGANIINSDFDLKIKLINDPLQAVKDNGVSTPINVSNQLVLKVNGTLSIGGISLLDKGQVTALLSDTKSDGFKRQILLYLDSSFTKQTITEIEVENERNDEIEIYVQRNEDSTGKLNIKSTKGKVKIYNNILDVQNENIGDLYNIEVSVSRGNDVLFTGIGTNNIIIRN